MSIQSNQVFDKLTTVEIVGKTTDKTNIWLCKCECGGEINRTSRDLNRNTANYCNTCKTNISRLAPLKRLYENYKWNAKDRNLEFSISFEEFYDIISKDCLYCGYPPSQVAKARGNNYPFFYNGIDRQDNTIGYLSGNAVSCCKFCNYAKGNKSLEIWMGYIQRLIEFNK